MRRWNFVVFCSFLVIGMTNPESHYPFVHWPVGTTSNSTGIYQKNPENCQIFHPPATPTLLTYFQQKEQAIHPTYEENTFFHRLKKKAPPQSSSDHHRSTNVGLTGISSSSCSSSPKQISSSSPIPFQPYLIPPFQTQNTPPYSSSMSNSTQISTPRKRKQLINDSNSFLTPTIPAKRTTPLTMFFPRATSSENSLVMLINPNQFSQTDSSSTILTSTDHLDVEQEHLTADIEELNRTKCDIQRQYESTMETIKRCLTMTRSLLIEKSQLEKKQARQKAMENRLRLGQFVTQRQGTSFVEQWIDGYDFLDKQRAQEQLTRAKENLDRERKNLTKKKSFLQQQLHLSTSIDESYQSQDSIHFIYLPTNKSKRINRISTNKSFNRYMTFQTHQ